MSAADSSRSVPTVVADVPIVGLDEELESKKSITILAHVYPRSRGVVVSKFVEGAKETRTDNPDGTITITLPTQSDAQKELETKQEVQFSDRKFDQLTTYTCRRFKLPRDVALQSKMVENYLTETSSGTKDNNTIETTSTIQDVDNVDIDAFKISEQIMEPIVEYLNHHYTTYVKEKKEEKAIPEPLPIGKEFDTLLDEWDSNFLKRFTFNEPTGNEMPFGQLLGAAHWFNITYLLEMCCAKIASKIKGKSPEEIKAILMPIKLE